MITKEELLKDSAEILRQELIQSLKDQGHYGRGNLAESLEIKISEGGGILKAQIFMSDYGLILETGVSANKVPFGEQRSNFSDYLQGLMDNLGVTLGSAIAIAKTAKIQGHPTDGSFKLSSNGKRTGWITEVLINTQTLEKVAQITLEKIVSKIN